jgi:hypothetical protein
MLGQTDKDFYDRYSTKKKSCIKCKDYLPVTEEFFQPIYRQSENMMGEKVVSGFYPICKICHAGMKKVSGYEKYNRGEYAEVKSKIKKKTYIDNKAFLEDSECGKCQQKKYPRWVYKRSAEGRLVPASMHTKMTTLLSNGAEIVCKGCKLDDEYLKS